MSLSGKLTSLAELLQAFTSLCGKQTALTLHELLQDANCSYKTSTSLH